VGRVRISGGDLSEMMIRRGYGWYYDSYAPNATELARLERQARNANTGLWSQVNPIPPWEWRDRTSGPRRPVKKGVVVIFYSRSLADLALSLGTLDFNFELIDGDQIVNLPPQ